MAPFSLFPIRSVFLNIADEIVVIADGKIVKQGTREEIMPEIMGTAAAVGVCSGFTGNNGKEDR